MAAVELHVHAIYYAQHPALKSVYGKSQSVIGGELFCSYRIVFGLAQGLWDFETGDIVNCSYEVLVQKEAIENISRYGIAIIVMCSVITISFCFIKVHTCDSDVHPCVGGKAPLLSPRSQYIFCKYIIEDMGKIHSLIAFYKLF